MNLVNDIDFIFSFHRRVFYSLDQITYFINSIIARRIDLNNVRMRVLFRQFAIMTVSARRIL